MHAVFRKLSTGTKLLVLCLTFIVAIAVPIYGLVQDRLASVDFVNKQLAGSRYLATLRRIYASILSNVPNTPSPLRPTQSSDEVLKVLAMTEARASGLMQTAELQRSLATTLHALWSSDPARTPTDSFVLDALNVTTELASRIGEDSNLALDPHPQSYYLQEIVTLKLPAIMNQLGDEQTLLGAVASAGRFSSERRGRLLIVDGLLRSTTAELRRDIGTAYRMEVNGSLKRKLDDDVNEMARNVGLCFNAADEQLAEGDAGNIELKALGPLYAAAVESSLRAWELVQGELDRLLTERVADLNAEMLQSLVLTGALAILSVAIAVMTYRNIVRPLHRLSSVVTQVRQGRDYQVRVHDAGQDEIGQLAAAFNDMLSALSASRHREMRLVDANIIGVFTWQLLEQSSKEADTVLLNANEAFLRMVGYDREDLISGRMRIAELTPPEWRDRGEQAWAELTTTSTLQPYEKEYFRKDGSRVPVLVGAARLEGTGNQGVAYVVGRIRALIKKAPALKEGLQINEAVLEVIALTRSEMAKNSISVRTQLADGLPLIQADRVQLQQVMLNLVVNTTEAMSEGSDGLRELLISTGRNASNGVLVSLRDSGPGLDPNCAQHLFDPFYTTKANGMGMGLAICRSVIEAHGGRLWSGTNEPRGRRLSVHLPLAETAP